MLSLSIFGCLPESPEEKKYEVKIVVFYPSSNDTLTFETLSSEYPELNSHRGTNYIRGVYGTTAPIKILSIKQLPK